MDSGVGGLGNSIGSSLSGVGASIGGLMGSIGATIGTMLSHATSTVLSSVPLMILGAVVIVGIGWLTLRR